MNPIILTSTSPRRKELLSLIGIPYYIIKPTFEEVITKSAGKNISAYFAEQKVLSILPEIKDQHLDAYIVLGADTVILHNNTVLGKPQNKDDAKKYLKQLSNDKHIVETSMAIYNRNTSKMTIIPTENIVKVRKLSNDDIEWYLDKNEWIDAAGAYKIQGSFQRFISHIEGTQSSIMGLPLFELCDTLITQGYVFT